MRLKFLLGILIIVSAHSVKAQIPLLTAEDSLHKGGLSAFLKATTIGGYGDIFYQRNFNQKTSVVDLERFVLFIGHRFSKNISLFTELEVEDAKIENGKVGGEVALEQAYLKFDVNQNNYFVAGLFLPRLGIMNEEHLPTQFNGNERTQVETIIIPSTWREIGIGYYGNLPRFPLYYSAGLINGLNAAGFEHGTGIREGRYEGQFASMNNIAVTASLQIIKSGLKVQVSGYYGGSAGLAPRQADSLKLNTGAFGTPVGIGEADVQYSIRGFKAKILGTIVAIPNASNINRAYASNTPGTEYGAYAEVSYNILEEVKKIKIHQLNVFVRYEKLDVNASIPTNGITDGILNQQHIVVGFSYLPIRNVVIKADVRFLHTGAQNPDLVINPSPVATPYRVNNTFLNLGIGWSF